MTSPLYQRFKEDLELRGFAPNSIATYTRLVKRLADHFMRPPDEITDEELRQYLLYLLRDRKYARMTMIGVISALRTFYRIVLHRSIESIQDVLPKMRTSVRLPQ